MAAFGNYDQGADAQARNDFELLPEGDYVGEMTESDVHANSKGTGQIMESTYVLETAGFKGRKVWGRINVQHNSSETQRIGQIELANLKAAIGMTQVQITDTLMLHNKRVGLRVKIEKAEPGSKYKDKNVIFDYLPADQVGAAPTAAAPAPYQAPAQQPAAANAPAAAPAPAPAAADAKQPPWMKKSA